MAVSFWEPEYTANTDAMGTQHMARGHTYTGPGEKTLVYQTSTSELFWQVTESPQNESTPFPPAAPMTWPSSTRIG